MGSESKVLLVEYRLGSKKSSFRVCSIVKKTLLKGGITVF